MPRPQEKPRSLRRSWWGDDADAKETVKVLIEEAGFEPFDAGGLDLAPDLEGFARINISLAYGPGKKGPFFYYFKR